MLLAWGAAVAAYGAWRVQDAVAPGRRRRFTGSYARASFSGNDFPATFMGRRRPAAAGLRSDRRRRPSGCRSPICATGDELVATLDCTGGFHTTQRWGGVRLLDLGSATREARPTCASSATRATAAASRSRTPATSLLATHVGGEPLSHGHGGRSAWSRPGRRGWQWVKWVHARSSCHDGPDPAALASAGSWSSFTPEGRGDA